jgi:hypothetical protein
MEAVSVSDKDLRKLLLRFVLSDGDDSFSAFSAWERSVVFDDSSFQSYKLLSAVYPRLLEHNIDSRLFLRIKGAHRRTWTENQLLLTHLRDLFEDLNNLRIDFIIGDAVFRATEIYNDLGIFSLQNFAVIAPITQKKEFCQSLINNLWELCDDVAHRIHCKKDKALGIDILWTDDVTFEDRSKEADFVLIGNNKLPILRAEEQILNLCEDRFLIYGDEDSDWQFIAGALFNSGEIESSKLIERAERRHLSREVANMIDAIKADFAVQVPAELLTELRNIRPRGRFLLFQDRVRRLRQDYRIYLEYETRDGLKPGFVEFMERRWETDSYSDLIRHGLRCCVRILQDR